MATLVVLAVLWAQPLWEQVFGAGRGNMTRLLTNSSGGDVKLGPAIATRFSAQVLIRPAWRLRSGFSDLLPPTGTTQSPDGPFVEVTRDIIGLLPAIAVLTLLAALLVVLGVSARRRGAPARAAACWIAAGGVVGAPFCLVARHRGAVLRARTTCAGCGRSGRSSTWSCCGPSSRRWPRDGSAGRGERLSSAIAVALTVILAIAAVPFLAQAQGPVADYAAMPALRRVFRDLDTLRSSAPVVYDTSTVRVFEPYSSAVMMRLQELGIEFRVTDDGMVRQLGERRRADGSETTTVFQLEGAAALLYDGPACRIAIASALDPDSERAAAATVDELAGTSRPAP